jgi:hypothetical protein
MLKNEAEESEQPLVAVSTDQQQVVEIPGASPVRLQRLDLARHIAVAPNGKRYVIATFNDSRLGRGYVTAVYPQQNDYLTLIRLTVCELKSQTPDEAIQKHISSVEAIQQGRLSDLVKSLKE